MTLRVLVACLVLVLFASAGAASAPGTGASTAADAAAPALQLADVVPPPEDEELASTGAPTPIDGRWLAGPGMVLELERGEYRFFADGRQQEHGTFSLDGDRIVSRSDDGREDRGRITREGGLILIEQDAGVPVLLRAEASAGGAPPAPSSVEGRWITADGFTLELAGGRAVFGDTAGGTPEVGSYRIDSGELVIVAANGDALRGPWVLIGGRLVIEARDEGVIVLAPQTGAGAQPVADTGQSAVAGAASPIDGRWQLAPGLVVEFAGGRYSAFEDGKAEETGTFTLDGDRITILEDGQTEGDTGRFARAGDFLLLEPDDDEPAMLLRAETPSGAAPAGTAADLIGRWRTDEGDIVELTADGRFIAEGPDGDIDQGGFRVEGNMLIVDEGPDGEQGRVFWAKFGDRIVLQVEGDEEVSILTPEPGTGAEPPPPPVATQPSEAVGELAADQATGELPAADEPLAATAAASVVDGRWVMGSGLVIEFAAGAYKVSEAGQVHVTGTFTIEGDTLLLRRDTDPADKVRRSRFTRAGDAMLIEPEDEEPVLMFAEASQGGSVGQAPELVEGRWRTNEGDLVELRAGRYLHFADDGTIATEGSYTVAGDTLSLVLPDITQSWRWARLGERVALQQGGDDETIILTPQPLVDTGQLPQQPVAGAAPPAPPAQETPPEVAAPQQPTGTGQAPAAPQPAQPVAVPEREAPAPLPPAGQAEPVQPPPLPTTIAAPLSDGTPLGEQWAGFLKGKRMVQGVGQMTMQLLDLCSDGRYVWLVGQGVETPRPQGTGSWSVLTQGQLASLQLTPTGAAPGLLQLDFDGQTAYLNRIPTQVLAMNQSCP